VTEKEGEGFPKPLLLSLRQADRYGGTVCDDARLWIALIF